MRAGPKYNKEMIMQLLYDYVPGTWYVWTVLYYTVIEKERGTEKTI